MLRTAAGAGLRRSVLIVDDEESVRQGLTSILESEQVEVKTAAGLREAERFLRAGCFDLIVTDLRMSGPFCFEGLEVIWRARERSPATQVVLFTAYGTREVAEAARRLGAADCWSKSMPISEIVERCRALGIPVVAKRDVSPFTGGVR